ncbi:MAG: beta-ketoacyl-[acyl-carrier-protein] synthase family protein [Desulfobacteraceae bacterium]
MKRVVITGMGIISPIGNDLETVVTALYSNRSGITAMEEWGRVKGLGVNSAGVSGGYDPKRISRRSRRTMGKMAVMAALSAMDALDQAGLDPSVVASARTGVAMGSTTGSGEVIEKMFTDFAETGGISRLEGTTFMKIMNHSVSANIAAMLGTRGRVLSPCAACSTSTQSIGEGFETIRNGVQEVMICGGADELHPSTAGVFDVLHAASKEGDDPSKNPRPFDRDRNGLVVGEGAGAVVLEALDHAKKRGAAILGEVIGYSTCCDGAHMTSPRAGGMQQSMEEALHSAGCRISEIDYINAHATGTVMGDIAEAEAIYHVAGNKIPVSGTKGYTGHTLAASGVMEVIFSLLMMKHNFIAPTLNLENIDTRCDTVLHVQRRIDRQIDRIMTSNFAFGGINATLIVKRWS